jgi:hypothetical protein
VAPVRATLVVFHSPRLYNANCFLQVIQTSGRSGIHLEPSIERLDKCVVRWLTRTAVINAHAVLICPQIDDLARKFRANVAKQHFRLYEAVRARPRHAASANIAPTLMASASREKTSTIVKARNRSPLSRWAVAGASLALGARAMLGISVANLLRGTRDRQRSCSPQPLAL